MPGLGLDAGLREEAGEATARRGMKRQREHAIAAHLAKDRGERCSVLSRRTERQESLLGRQRTGRDRNGGSVEPARSGRLVRADALERGLPVGDRPVVGLGIEGQGVL